MKNQHAILVLASAMTALGVQSQTNPSTTPAKKALVNAAPTPAKAVPAVEVKEPLLADNQWLRPVRQSRQDAGVQQSHR